MRLLGLCRDVRKSRIVVLGIAIGIDYGREMTMRMLGPALFAPRQYNSLFSTSFVVRLPCSHA